jgi:hypothetical protein
MAFFAGEGEVVLSPTEAALRDFDALSDTYDQARDCRMHFYCFVTGTGIQNPT